ncbi:MarR family transcriptional regulator [Actinoplanes sp. NPDC026619]|uniref:MarR family winged helix-turn-helix transcriptional regulator n=1 Tax=Actinoplanes sp. NPDC026619 TaxID=3155798 RepID=UPI00340EEAA0
MRRSADLMELLTRAERLMSRRLAAVLAEAGQSLDAWRVITLLADGRGHFMTELADGAFLPPGSLTRLVDQLVDTNLLYRRVDDVDRRRIRAYLTPRGHRLHQRISESVRGVLPVDEELEQRLAGLIEGLENPVTGITF